MCGGSCSAETRKRHAAVGRSAFSIQNVQSTSCAAAFRSSDVQKQHAAVARSTFASQNVKKLMGSDRFLKFRCRKMAGFCGATHICKPKCEKLTGCRKMACCCGMKRICKSRCAKHLCWHTLELTMWKRCLTEKRKVNTQSVNESISQLVNQPASQLVSLSISQLVSLVGTISELVSRFVN